MIKELLAQLLDNYNDKQRIKGSDGGWSFDACFGPIYQLNQDNIDKFIDDYTLHWDVRPRGSKIPEAPSYYDLYNEFDRTNKRPDATGTSAKNRKEYEAYYDKKEAFIKRKRDDYIKKYGDQIRKGLLGSIIIHSEDDNSIPYDIWDDINDVLNGTNYHLG